MCVHVAAKATTADAPKGQVLSISGVKEAAPQQHAAAQAQFFSTTDRYGDVAALR